MCFQTRFYDSLCKALLLFPLFLFCVFNGLFSFMSLITNPSLLLQRLFKVLYKITIRQEVYINSWWAWMLWILTQYLEFGGLLVAKSNNSKIQKLFQTFAPNCCFQQPLSMYAVQSLHRLNSSKKAYSYSHDGCVQTFDLICNDCKELQFISYR